MEGTTLIWDFEAWNLEYKPIFPLKNFKQAICLENQIVVSLIKTISYVQTKLNLDFSLAITISWNKRFK